MTGDPERILTGGDASELEGELLGSLRDVGPDGDAKERAWTGIAARIAAVSVIGTTAATATSAAASTGSSVAPAATAAASGASAATALAKTGGGVGWLAKLALAATVTGGAVTGGVWLSERQAAETPGPGSLTQPPAVSAARSVPTTPLASATAEAPSEPPPAELAEGQVRSGGAVGKRRAGTKAELLAIESALLTQARAELRAGNASRAELTLERLRSEFPAGVLGQEREVLAIEVLAARGQTAAAAKRAEAFRSRYPKSPHNETLRRFSKAP